MPETLAFDPQLPGRLARRLGLARQTALPQPTLPGQASGRLRQFLNTEQRQG